MTNWVNPTTRLGGVDQIVVPERPAPATADAPYDDEQYVRLNGEWVPVDTPDIVFDTIAPNPPTALTATGSVLSSGVGVHYTLTWTAPTQNVDGSVCTDLNYYVVRWRYGTSGPYASFVSKDPSTFLDLVPGVNFEWGVTARDTSGNDSTWATKTTTGVVDTVGPEKPSLPILTTSLGTITATWDGLDYAGATPTLDFDHLNFYVSATSGGPWTYVDRVSGAGSAYITDVPIGATRYVTTVAVDTSGNSSVRSNQASIVVQGVTLPDFEPGELDPIINGITQAQATADGKSTVYYSTAPPGTAPNKAGDLWWEYDSVTGRVKGLWEGKGGTLWTSRVLDNLVIGTLDAAKITTGYLSANRIDANSLVVSKLLVGDDKNLVANGTGELGVYGGALATSPGVSFEATDKPTELRGVFKTVAGQGSVNSGAIGDFGWDCTPGEEFYIEMWVKADRPDSRMYIDMRDQANAIAAANRASPGEPFGGGTTYPMQSLVIPTTWSRYVSIATASATATRMRIGTVYYNHSTGTERGAVQLVAIRVRRRGNGKLIVDGGIYADNISANAITANKIEAGAVTTTKIQSGAVVTDSLAANSVTVDKLAVGSITADKIALGVYSTNPILDPSFEESYTWPVVASANDAQWANLGQTGTATATRARAPHSGDKSMRLNTPAATDVSRMRSNIFKVIPGTTQVLTLSVAKEFLSPVSHFSCRVSGGSTTALTEKPGDTFANAIPYDGADPNLLENLDVRWVANDLSTVDVYTDTDANGIANGLSAYVNGTPTGGTRTVDMYGQRLTATSIVESSTQRWGVVSDWIDIKKGATYRVTLRYSGFAGTNTRFRFNVEAQDQAGGGAITTAGVVYASGSTAVLTVNITAAANVWDSLRVFGWLEANTGTTATSSAIYISGINLEEIDPATGITDPAEPQYDTINAVFTVPAGINYCALRLYNTGQSGGPQSVFIDDVSCMTYGNGGTELTAAGLRLFDETGLEVGAFVSNRPNYLTISRNGSTVAGIADDGSASFQSMNSVNDGSFRGRQLLGKQGDTLFETVDFINDPVNYGRDLEVEPIGLLESYAKGVVAWSSSGGNVFSTTVAAGQELGMVELGFDMEPGRMYVFRMNPLLIDITNVTASALAGLRVRGTTDGTTPSLASTVYVYNYQPITSNTYVTISCTSRLFIGSVTTQTQLRLLVGLYASACSAKVYASSNNLQCIIEDVGPAKTNTGTVRNIITGTPPPATKTYVTTWTSTGAACYMGNNAKDSSQGSEDMKQGYSSYDGQSKSIWTFSSGIYSTISTAAVSKTEVYLYANHWYNSSGGTALIGTHNSASIPSTAPTITYRSTSTGWPKPGGRWVTLPAAAGAAFKGNTAKGIAVGPTTSTSMTYYGRFNKSGAQIRITYVK